MQILSDKERVRRSYNKTNIEYWENELKETRSKRRKAEVGPSPELQQSNTMHLLDIQSLSAVEIREKLKELGVMTRVRKLEKLREILQHELKL